MPERTPSSVQAEGNGDTESATAEHACLDETTPEWDMYEPEWDSISILDQAKNNRIMLVKEALHISSAGQHTLLNRDQGTAISDRCWHANQDLTPPPKSALPPEPGLSPVNSRPKN